MTWGKKHLALAALGLSIMGLSAPSLEAQNRPSQLKWVVVMPFADSNEKNRSGLSQAPRPRGTFSRWMKNGDYPYQALREERKGNVALLLTVTRVGRVRACDVTQSSGHDDLDRSACKNLSRRARFVPARNYVGKHVEGVYPIAVQFFSPPWKYIAQAEQEGIISEPPVVISAD